MARPYASGLEHLDDLIGIVGTLFERQIVAAQGQGLLGRALDAHTGSFVAPEQVAAILRANLVPADAQERLDALDASITARIERMEARLEATRETAPLPWDRLRAAFALSKTEQLALMVLVAVDVAPGMRQLMRFVVNEAGRLHPDLGLIAQLVYPPGERLRLLRELSPEGKLLRFRLIETVGGRAAEDSPYLLRPLRAARRVLELAHGILELDREVAGVATLDPMPVDLDQLLIAEPIKQEVVNLLREADGTTGTSPVLVLCGSEGSGRKSLLRGAAAALGRGVLHVRCADLPVDGATLVRLAQAMLREAVLHRAVPLLDGAEQLSADETGRPDRAHLLDNAILDHFGGPVAATAPRVDSRPVRFARGLVMVDIPTPTETARAELWDRQIGNAEVAARAAARYPITGGVIAKSAESALARARARGEPVRDDDVHVGVRSTLDSKLSTLGVRIQWRQTWDDLVLPEEAVEEILEFSARVRYKRLVYEDWGFARKMAKGLGLSALFSGPPGTGKTMVAGLIAEELGLDLYQIDLSRIVSKYVGETEKNLAQLFDAAEAGHAILLFDEADSLFAKRTEVKSSVDRYANLEVNYLLQRMEAFNGITILTTNLDSAIDEAFRRRLSFRIDFPLPESEERNKLWQTMLPREASVGADVDFGLLAGRYVMSGGYIRNAVLRAAFMAAQRGEAIGMRDLLRAANLEYTAMGKVMHAGLK